MKRYVRCSAGDVTLFKFVLIPMDMIPSITEDYDDTLHGYFYLWEYTYNTVTHDTDDRMNAHSDVLDSLPSEIRRVSRGCTIWGKTDWYQSGVRFYINDTSELSKSQLNYIKKCCNM